MSLSLSYDSVPSYTVKIYIAGDIQEARRLLRKFCMKRGACFTLTPTDFIYTGGAEAGMCIGLENYPRFKSTELEMEVLANELTIYLIKGLCQKTALIVEPNETTWVHRKEIN